MRRDRQTYRRTFLGATFLLCIKSQCIWWVWSSELRDSNLHASKRFYLPRVSTCLIPTLRSSSLPHTHTHTYTHTCHHPICFYASQMGHDPPCLGTHIHLPLDYDCQETDQNTTTHRSTASQLARLTPKFHAYKNTHSTITSHNQICKIDEY